MSVRRFTGMVGTTVAPYAAGNIGAYGTDGRRLGGFGTGVLRPDYGERLYRFGVLSDVHNQVSQGTENMADLANALREFKEREDVGFVVVCGDLTQLGSDGKLARELEVYKGVVDSVSQDVKVYPTTGNHDCPRSGWIDFDVFSEKTGIQEFLDGQTDCSYEIVKTVQTSDGRMIRDHFLFLGMGRYDFGNAYSEKDLDWLETKLRTHRQERCFIVTHLFFPDGAGNFREIYPQYNWLKGTQLERLKSLRGDYPNAVWFSGHSHWKWYLQGWDPKANVFPTTNEERGMAWTSHIPSCAEPIDSNVGNPSLPSERVSMPLQSQGAVVDVYADYVDIRGISFKDEGDETYVYRYVPVAQNRLDVIGAMHDDPPEPEDPMVYVTQEMIHENLVKKPGITVTVDDSTHDVSITFTNNSQGVLICRGGTYVGLGPADSRMDGTDITGSDIVKIHHDGVEWLTAEPPAAALKKIGFYGGGYTPGQTATTYTLESGMNVDTSKNSLQLQTSSSFIGSGGQVPCKLIIKNLRYEIIKTNQE